MRKVHDIPTTIVTGFLGAGKTTAINHLLSEKPADERWGVLVNEFGQIGVDGALIGPRNGVSIREVSGGCLCCSAGQAFEVALNRLIRDTCPDRILIEPTGIGHPLKIIRTLTGGYFSDVLDLRATICIVDARKLGESKYREHQAFMDQLNLADVLVGNKADCYSDYDRSLFMELVSGSTPAKAASSMISFGMLDSGLLELQRSRSRLPGFPNAHAVRELPFSLDELPKPSDGKSDIAIQESWTRYEGSGKGFWSGSWLIGADYCFDKSLLCQLLDTVPFARVKGVMRCNDGWLKINGCDGVLGYSSTVPFESSRFEIVDDSPLLCMEVDRKLRETLLSE